MGQDVASSAGTRCLGGDKSQYKVPLWISIFGDELQKRGEERERLLQYMTAGAKMCRKYLYIRKVYKNYACETRLAQVKSMDDNSRIVEWVECMGVASGCGEQEVRVASGSGWNLWVWF